MNIMLVVCLQAAALGATGPVEGVVLDPSGAPIPGAKVTLADTVRRTDSNGRFRLAGQGLLQVEKAGFQPFTARIDKPRKMTIRLVLASARSEITVTAANPVEPDANADAIRLDAETLAKLPIPDGDPIAAALLWLDPASAGDGGASVVVDGAETRDYRPSASEIQEIRINQNPYAAEFRRPGRGRIEVITKRAPDRYRGSLQFLFRDYHLNARNALAHQKPVEQRRDFEGSLSGPLGRGNTTAFSLGLEREEDDSQAVVIARNLTGEVRENVAAPERSTEWFARIFRNTGDGESWSLRYEYENESSRAQGIGGISLPDAAYDELGTSHHLLLQHRGIRGPRMFTELTVEAGIDRDLIASLNPAVPRITVLDAFHGGSAQRDESERETHASITAAIHWQSGKHLIRAGAAIPEWSRAALIDRSNYGGVFTYASLDDYRNERPLSIVTRGGEPFLHTSYLEAGAFVQDQIQLRSNLVTAIGLRYDWQRYLPDRSNFSPRVSLAWAPAGTRAVFRAGFGLFHDRASLSAIRDTLRFNGRRVVETLWTPSVGSTETPISIVSFASGIRTPYLAQWSFGAELRLRSKTTLAAHYTGQRGIKLFRSRDGNAPAGPEWLRPDPSTAIWRIVEAAGRSQGDSIEFMLRGTLTRWFSGFVSYRLGRIFDNTSGIGWLPPDSTDLRREWGRSSFDRRHRLRVTGVWRLPADVDLGVEVEADSGEPYELTTGRDENRDGRAVDRPFGARRNALSAPGAFETDVRLSREFSWNKQGDRSPELTISVDAFNLFNRANYESLIGNLNSPWFGRPTAAQSPRRIQLGLSFSF
jgi:hypothetical protein